MELSQITPLILTWNEEPNLEHTLSSLKWAHQIIVLDSFSADRTREIACAFANVRFVQRAFDSHAQQWNFGLEQVGTPWVFSLDADYVVTTDVAHELGELNESDVAAYFAAFRYCVGGRALRSTLLPPRAVLFRRANCRYVQQGHTQMLEVRGATGFLKARILHDDRKSLSRWLSNQDKYAALEAESLLSTRAGSLSPQDRLRLWIVPAPFAVLIYTLFVKGLVLDGWAGWLYAFQRMVAELILSLHLIEARLHRSSTR